MRERIIIVILLIACGGMAVRLYHGDDRHPAAPRHHTNPLEIRLPQVAFDGVPAMEAMERLAQMAGANLCVLWNDLRAAGAEPDVPVTLHLHDVTLDVAFQCLLNSAYNMPSLTAEAEENVVIVADSSRADIKRARWAAYDVSALLSHALTAYQGWYEPRRPQGGWRGSGSGSAGFTDEEPPALEDLRRMGTQEVSDELIKLLMQTVAPDSWRDVGGSVGRIQYFSGRLVVHQTPAAHRAIAEFLDMLRNAPDWPTSPATIVRAPATRPVDPVLAMHVHLPAYRQTPLTKIIEDLGEATHLNTFIRRPAIERSGIYATIEVNCGEFDGQLSDALQMIEDAVEVASDGIRFRFQLRNTLIVFSSADDLRVETVLRSYDVRDLLRADLEEQHRLLAASKGQWVQWDYQEINKAVERLTAVIAKAYTGVDVEGEKFIDPRTQEFAGEMQYWGGRLFIRQRAEGFDRIEAMLSQMRRMRSYPPPSTRPAPAGGGRP